MPPSPSETLIVEEQGDVVLFTLTMALPQAPWADVERAGDQILERLSSRSSPKCLIDLSQLELMGSSVVALITRIWKSVTSRGGQCVLACPNEVPLEVISIAGLQRIWTVVPSRAEALGILRPAGRLPMRLLAVISLVAAVVALAGLILKWANIAIPESLLSVLVPGAAGGGLLMGMFNFLLDAAPRRYLGLTAAIISAASLALAVCCKDFSF